MKKSFLIINIILIAFMYSCQENNKTYNYPETRKDNVVDEYFGTKVQDPYRWLENDSSQETKDWVKKQNNVTFDFINKIPFRNKIKEKFTQIYNYARYSVPFKRGGNYFFFKNDGLQNQDVLFIQKSLDDKPTIILNPNELSKDGTVALSSLGVSEDGRYLGYSVSKGGSDWQEIFVKDIKTNKLTDDHILDVKFSNISWYNDGFFYSRYPSPKKSEALSAANQFQKIYYHKLGTSQDKDVLIYKNDEHPNYMYDVKVSDDKKYIFLNERESTSGNALYFSELNLNKLDFKCIHSGFKYDFSAIDHINGKLYISTNCDAPEYKLIAVSPENYAKDNWEDIIPKTEDILTHCYIRDNRLITIYMHDAHSVVKFYDIDGKYQSTLQLPGIGSVGKFSAIRNENIAFYSFSSYTTPPVIFKYDFETQKSEIYRQPEIKGLDFNKYTSEQVFYESKDGTKIPMFITYKKGMKRDGDNPTLLYGYGGFNISITPSFSISRMLWLQNGGILAVANLRGGGEYGEKWHKGGTLTNKQNVFDDFISAAEYLINNKYTSSKKLAIQGGSNGGLLIGAVTNQRPDLFAVSLAHVGVMDMLRYQNFTIGKAWRTDYGLSSDSKEMFEYLYGYSPLHNVSDTAKYPAVLVITADHDDRVVPAHSFKYIATLQEKYKGNNPVMIRIETQAGHGAGKPVSKQIEELADIYSFIYQNMNINPYK